MDPAEILTKAGNPALRGVFGDGSVTGNMAEQRKAAA